MALPFGASQYSRFCTFSVTAKAIIIHFHANEKSSGPVCLDTYSPPLRSGAGTTRNTASASRRRLRFSIRSNKKTGAQLRPDLFLEAPPGFEPGNQGFADPCLTTWLWRRLNFARLNGSSTRLNKKWSGLRGSNSLPPPWQGGALPDELNPQKMLLLYHVDLKYASPFLPIFATTPALTDRIVSQNRQKPPVSIPAVLSCRG